MSEQQPTHEQVIARIEDLPESGEGMTVGDIADEVGADSGAVGRCPGNDHRTRRTGCVVSEQPEPEQQAQRLDPRVDIVAAAMAEHDGWDWEATSSPDPSWREIDRDDYREGARKVLATLGAVAASPDEHWYRCGAGHVFQWGTEDWHAGASQPNGAPTHCPVPVENGESCME